jgi:hypothetical protein
MQYINSYPLLLVLGWFGDDGSYFVIHSNIIKVPTDIRYENAVLLVVLIWLSKNGSVSKLHCQMHFYGNAEIKEVLVTATVMEKSTF